MVALGVRTKAETLRLECRLGVEEPVDAPDLVGPALVNVLLTFNPPWIDPRGNDSVLELPLLLLAGRDGLFSAKKLDLRRLDPEGGSLEIDSTVRSARLMRPRGVFGSPDMASSDPDPRLSCPL
jgi:hypothetical protein